MLLEENEKPSYFAIIPADVRYDKDLTPMAKLLYGEITCLTQKNGYCWASNSYFAELYGMSKDRISKLISSLEKNGYITIEIIRNENKQIVQRIIRLTLSVKITEPIVKNNETPIVKKDKDNITSIINNTSNNNINTSTEKPKKSNSKAPLFDRIKEYTQNEELRECLSKYLQFKLSTRKNFTLDQWNILLEDLARYGRGDDKVAIDKVKSSYAKGYQAIVYENEIVDRNKIRNTSNTNVVDRLHHKQDEIDYTQSAGVVDDNGVIGF